MPTKHVIHQIQAYLDHQLPPVDRHAVEEHAATCPTCTRHLLQARRVAAELGPAMQASLGRPNLPPGLRYKIRQELAGSRSQASFPWILSGRVLNAVGTLAVIVLLAVGVFVVIQGQIPGVGMPAQPESLHPNDSGGPAKSAAIPTPAPTVMTGNTPTPLPAASASAGDTLPQLTPAASDTAKNGELLTPAKQEVGVDISFQPEANATGSPAPITPPGLPEGTIAFSFFNPAPDRQVYEIHLIEADGTNQRLFPLDGVSEPALRLMDDGHQLAYRAWSAPTSPRALLSSNLKGETPAMIGGFFEDSQPDWSPTEYRLIFASQRESDRRWRLYTIWGDGSAEKELRREGKSPSFAPDGHQFVFEGCDNSGNRCGLWLGNLDNSEYGSTPLLTDPLAKSPDWSPLGDRIVYMAAPDDNWDLYLIDSDGSGTPRRLTTAPAIDGLPVWSPDGQWLAFLSNRDGNWGIWLLHIDNGDLRQIFKFEGGIFTPPAGEPYGERNWWDEQLSWSR